MSGDLDDICANRHGGSPTSSEAHASLGRMALETLRAKVAGFVRSRGTSGATCEEIEAAMGLRHQTASARCAELKRLGILRDSGRRRPTSSGRPASVLEFAE